MSKATLWKAGANFRRLNTGVPSSPLVAVSTDALPPADLLAIADKETADGWPAPIVAKATARRGSKVKMWLGPKGVCFGVRPDLSITGRNINWLRTLANERAPSGLFNVPAYPLSTAGIVPNDGSYVAPKLETMYTSVEHASKMVRHLVGDDSLIITSMTRMRLGGYPFDNMASPQHKYMTMLPAPQEGHMIVAYCYIDYQTYPNGDADQKVNQQSWAVCQVIRRPEYSGIEVMLFQHGSDSWVSNASSYEQALPSLSAIRCQPGVLNLLRLFNPKIGDDRQYRAGGARRYAWWFPPLETVDTAPHARLCGLAQSADIDISVQAMNLNVIDVYHIGDPEFGEHVSFLGDLTVGSDGWTLANTSLFIEWQGERLIDMNPGMAEADRKRLRGKWITTHLSDVPLYADVALSQLSMYGDASEAGLDLATEVFMPAKEGNPAVTFAEAVSRANAADRRLFHRIVGHEPDLHEKIHFVKIIDHPTEANSRACVGYYAGGTTTDKDTCMLAVAEGAAVINKSSFVGDAVVDFFGLTETELRANNYRAMRKFEFSESYVFRGALPDLRKLDTPERTAQILVQHALNRKSFSQFAVGAITMASVARRQLL